MCSKHTHTCKYCGNEYRCNEKNWVCPTLNGDVNANMCYFCNERLEEKLSQMDDVDTNLTPEQILEVIDDD